MPAVDLFEIQVLDRRTGVWCDHCLLPAVIETDAALVHQRTLRVVATSTCSWCVDCGHTATRPAARERTTE